MNSEIIDESKPDEKNNSERIYERTPDKKADIIKAVITALENPKYDWRTIDGIVNETLLAPEVVRFIIKSQDNIIRSPIPDDKGNPLYTTRDHYYKTRGLINRFLTASSGHIRA